MYAAWSKEFPQSYEDNALYFLQEGRVNIYKLKTSTKIQEIKVNIQSSVKWVFLGVQFRYWLAFWKC